MNNGFQKAELYEAYVFLSIDSIPCPEWEKIIDESIQNGQLCEDLQIINDSMKGIRKEDVK